MRSVLMAAALGATAAAVPAQEAADPEAGLRAAFAAADVNGDGAVGVDEYVAYVRDVFLSLDKGGDRELEPGDVPNVKAARFAAIDRDGSGTVSLGEALAERVMIFYETDKNGDGALSVDELLAYEAAQK